MGTRTKPAHLPRAQIACQSEQSSRLRNQLVRSTARRSPLQRTPPPSPNQSSKCNMPFTSLLPGMLHRQNIVGILGGKYAGEHSPRIRPAKRHIDQTQWRPISMIRARRLFWRSHPSDSRCEERDLPRFPFVTSGMTQPVREEAGQATPL